LIPGQGAKVAHTSMAKKQNRKQKHYYSKFNKDFKNGPHQKKKKSKKYHALKIGVEFYTLPQSSAFHNIYTGPAVHILDL